jgi:hypothetical protein
MKIFFYYFIMHKMYKYKFIYHINSHTTIQVDAIASDIENSYKCIKEYLLKKINTIDNLNYEIYCKNVIYKKYRSNYTHNYVLNSLLNISYDDSHDMINLSIGNYN